MTRDEALDRITFLSAGLVLSAEAMIDRWPEWYNELDAIKKQHGIESLEVLFWRCDFARPAYEALGLKGK